MTTCDCGHLLTAHQTGDGPWTGFCGATQDVGGYEAQCECEAPTVDGGKDAMAEWPPKDVEQLQEAIHRGSQSVEYTLIAARGGRSYRVRIDRDSYDMQSSARVDLWTGSGPMASGWVNVASLPWEDTATATYNGGVPLRAFGERGAVQVAGGDRPDVSRYTSDTINLARFRTDARALLALAVRIG